MASFDVTLRFQFPAWDEANGISYPGISSRSKAEAINWARKMARDDGHIGTGGKGRTSF